MRDPRATVSRPAALYWRSRIRLVSSVPPARLTRSTSFSLVRTPGSVGSIEIGSGMGTAFPARSNRSPICPRTMNTLLPAESNWTTRESTWTTSLVMGVSPPAMFPLMMLVAELSVRMRGVNSG